MSQGIGVRRTNATIDTLLQLEDGLAAITGSGIGSVAFIDLQAAGLGQTNPAVMHADLQLDVSNIDIAGGDELYEVVLEGSDDSGFTTGAEEELARINLGHNSVIVGDTDTDIGRYVIPVTNERNGRTYRYVRLNFVITAAVDASITCTAHLTKRVGL